MDDKLTQDLATRAFHKRALDELIALRGGQAETRKDFGELRQGVGQLRDEVMSLQIRQAAMANDIVAIDPRLATLEQRVDDRLQEIRSIWEAVQIQLQRLGDNVDTVFEEFHDLRNEIKLHGRRIAELERRLS